MGNSYLYAGTRAKTLERKLLSETQLELLTSAKGVEEMHKVLYDTYLAPFLDKKNGDTTTLSIDKSIVDAKKTLQTIAPQQKMLDILWIKYDLHNLKTIIKGKKAGLTDEQILEKCFRVGLYSPEKILKAYTEKHLHHIDPYLKEVADTADAAQYIFEIDLAMNAYYFKIISALSQEVHDPFITKFVILLIDLYNIKATLRADAIEGIEQKDVYLPGGTLTMQELATKEKVLKVLPRFGGEKRWKQAIEDAEKNHSYSQLEKAADEYVTDFLKQESLLIFTPASLFSYFHAQKNNAQIIGAILTAKKSGMSEKELRTILRRLHT
jgi:V/A-type H+-transporting ATPase subunit C